MKVLVIKDNEDGLLKPQAGAWAIEGRPDYARAVKEEWDNRTHKRFKGCSLVEAELKEII